MLDYRHCTLCPRACGVDRTAGERGFCQMPDHILAARAALHYWEEPVISGSFGSGAVFFSGCTLRCAFCQNGVISQENFGKEVSSQELRAAFERLIDEGCQNINLVTPTHFVPWILPALEPPLPVPVVYNCGGYESLGTLRTLEGRVQIYLPDLKYYDSALSARYSAAPDYFAVAAQALREMFRQVGPVRFDENGMLQSGMVVRHLVLPGAHKDSLRLLNWLADNFSPEDIRLSLMSQYTPPAGIAIRELQRPIFTYEYRKACERAEELGFLGYTQQRSSADAAYTPPFDGTGL